MAFDDRPHSVLSFSTDEYRQQICRTAQAFECSHLPDGLAINRALLRDASKSPDARSASPISPHTTPRFPSATAKAPEPPRDDLEAQLTLPLIEARSPPPAVGAPSRSPTNVSKWLFASWWFRFCRTRRQREAAVSIIGRVLHAASKYFSSRSVGRTGGLRAEGTWLYSALL